MTTTLRFQADNWAKRLGVLRTLADSKSLPVLGYLRLLGRDGRLTATAGDMTRWLTVDLGETDTAGDALLPVHKLTDILRALPTGTECALRPDPDPNAYVGGKHRLSAGKRSYVLAGLNPQDFPSPDPVGEADTINLPAGNVANVLETVLPAIHPGDARPMLAGVALELDGARAWWIGTDGHRLHVAAFSVERASADDGPRIIPFDTARLLERLARMDVERDAQAQLHWMRAETALLISGNGWRLHSALVDARYPDWRRLMPPDSDAGEIRLHAPAIRWRQALAPLLAVQSDLSHAVIREVEISARAGDGHVRVRAVGEVPDDSGDIELVLSHDQVVSQGFHATFNPGLLRDALGVFADDDIAGVSILPGAQRDDGAWGVLHVRRLDGERAYFAKVMPTAPRHDYDALFARRAEAA